MKAFPRADGKFDSSKPDEKGMDLRDYFAAKVLQSLVADFREDLDWNAHENSALSYEIADAMMKAREKREWVGLTDYERMELAVKTGAMSAEWLVFMEAVEAKLKEKNT